MKKILSFFMISLICILFAGCTERTFALEPIEYTSSISNFYNDSVNAFDNCFANNRIAISTVNSTLNNIDNLKSGYNGEIYKFANFIPAVDYLININTKSGAELYAYNFNGQFKLYNVKRQNTSNARYYMFKITLSQGNDFCEYTVKVEKKEGGFNVSCPKIVDFEIQKNGANDITETYQVFFERDKSYLQIKNVTNISAINSYEMCFDKNNNFIYRRNFKGLVQYEARFNTEITNMKMLVICSKSDRQKIEFVKFTNENFNFKTFAESSNLDVYSAKIVTSGANVPTDTYEQFILELGVDVNVYFAESLVGGEN